MNKALLILDLDETLVYSCDRRLDTDPDFTACGYCVYRRPSLSDFLQFCFEHFRVAVWTSSSEDYARRIVASIFAEHDTLEFMWAAQRCTPRPDPIRGSIVMIKDLKKVRRKGYDLSRVLMIDDSPEKLKRSYGNHLWIRPFEGDPGDGELLRLTRYLLWLKDQSNFRNIDKRDWRNHRSVASGSDGTGTPSC